MANGMATAARDIAEDAEARRMVKTCALACAGVAVFVGAMMALAHFDPQGVTWRAAAMIVPSEGGTELRVRFDATGGEDGLVLGEAHMADPAGRWRVSTGEPGWGKVSVIQLPAASAPEAIELCLDGWRNGGPPLRMLRRLRLQPLLGGPGAALAYADEGGYKLGASAACPARG